MAFSLFKKKDKESGNSKYLTLTVKEVVRETADTVTLIFDKTTTPFFYKPGQFLTLIFEVDGKEERRSYSLCSSPFTDEFPAVTIKRVSDGKISNFINDSIKPGYPIKALPAMGSFTTDPQKEQQRTAVVFGAGSGITPLMSIMKSILHIEPKSRVFLIYGNRNEESIIFKNELANIKEHFQDRFQPVHVLSQPSPAWTGKTGRLTKETIKEILQDLPDFRAQEADYFMCGPTGFMHTAEEALDEMKVSKGRIFKESFVASGTDKEISGSTSEIVEREVKIILDSEEFTFAVPPKRTVLECGLDQNIDMPFSCQSGICTACRGKLLSGKVHMEETDGLSDDELAKGYVLCCVSHPLTDDVKIEIG